MRTHTPACVRDAGHGAEEALAVEVVEDNGLERVLLVAEVVCPLSHTGGTKLKERGYRLGRREKLRKRSGIVGDWSTVFSHLDKAASHVMRGVRSGGRGNRQLGAQS